MSILRLTRTKVLAKCVIDSYSFLNSSLIIVDTLIANFTQPLNIFTPFKKHLFMKKLLLLVIGLFFINVAMSQNNALNIINLNTNKEKIIKENRRIKLITSDGRKIKGRFKVENNSTILIDNVRINLTDIEELKRNPLLSSILTSGFLVYYGAITAGFSFIIAALGDSSGFLLTIPAAALIYIGSKSPNFNKNHKTEKGWKFEIITISD
jgi:hypothetical protein